MARRIIKKIYYRITFTLKTALAIGSGENQYTDRDLMKNSKGHPYIPAAAIAGVCRELVCGLDAITPDVISRYFGDVQTDSGRGEAAGGNTDGTEESPSNPQQESRLVFYDANIMEGYLENYRTSIRDSVRLDDFKTAEKGAKFDMEVLEPGVSFETYLEQNIFDDKDDEDFAGLAAGLLVSGDAFFGGRTTRGYGEIEKQGDSSGQKISTISFDLRSLEDADRWIGFDIYDDKDDGWKEFKPEDNKKPAFGDTRVRLGLEQAGGISIRKYSTDTGAADYSQLTMEDVNKRMSGGGSTVAPDDKCTQVPVIPGTSWAGAIRHRMKELGLSDSDAEAVFGFVESGKKRRSSISFGESHLHGGSFKTLSRNAVDRFSGGTVDGALFTEETYYGGNTELEIHFHKSDCTGDVKDRAARLLAAALTDLHYGFLAVGGETSIGRGLFKITGIDDEELGTGEGNIPSGGSDSLYELLLGKIRAAMDKA